MGNSSTNWYLGSAEFHKGPYPQSLICQAVAEGRMKGSLGACQENTNIWKPISEWSELANPVMSHTHGADTKTNSDFSKDFVGTQQSQSMSTSSPHSSTAETAEQDAINRMINDVNYIDFVKDVVPVDLSNLSPLTHDPFFWGTIFLGVGPLLICTFNDAQIQSTGMAFFFAVLWGFVFKMLVAKNCQDYGLSLAAFFFTGLVGIASLFVCLRFLPAWYIQMPHAQNVVVRLIGSIVQTGFMEELCKFIPPGLYLIWKRRDAKPLMIVWIAICSGLGFAAFENLLYAKVIAADVVAQSSNGNIEPTSAAVQQAMLTYVLRSLSCVFGHAVWAGIFAYFVAIAFATGQRVPVLCCLGLSVAATFHGVYNWFCGIQPTFAAVSNAVAFVLFYGYLIKLRSQIGEERMAPHLSV